MPKVVDHRSRREELVRAVWRILARRGPSAVTMRQIAGEAGYSNGALKPYFSGKADLIEATYTYVFERTNERVARASAGLSGVEALTAFCREVMPLDEERLDEARVVMAFWQEAAHDPARAEHNTLFMRQWSDSLRGWLEEARTTGAVREDVDLPASTDALLTFLLGTQVTAGLAPATVTPPRLERQLRAQLAPLLTHREDDGAHAGPVPRPGHPAALTR